MGLLIESYNESNWVDGAAFIYDSLNTDIAGQSFTSLGGKLFRATFYLYKAGAPTGNATAYLYAHTGAFGVSSIPTGSALASSSTSFDVATLTTNPILVTFNFSGSNEYFMTLGTNYCIACFYNSSNGTNPVKVGKDVTTPTHSGNAFDGIKDSSYTARSGDDTIFYVYSSVGVITNSLRPRIFSPGLAR